MVGHWCARACPRGSDTMRLSQQGTPPAVQCSQQCRCPWGGSSPHWESASDQLVRPEKQECLLIALIAACPVDPQTPLSPLSSLINCPCPYSQDSWGGYVANLCVSGVQAAQLMNPYFQGRVWAPKWAYLEGIRPGYLAEVDQSRFCSPDLGPSCFMTPYTLYSTLYSRIS